MSLISILMPVKNAAKYLPTCLDSILSQSDLDWELIAVNDHSSDESLKILEAYAKLDQRIRWINQSETGIIWALKNAFEQSTGHYIHRMDADDIMPREKLEKLRSILQKCGRKCIATGKVKYFADNTLSEGYIKYQDWLNSLCDKNKHWNEIYKECVVPSPCWLIAREDLIQAGAFEPMRYPEDYDLCFRFYEAGFHVHAHQDVLHHWRDHPERSSRNDEHYASAWFFELKIHYFLKLERDTRRPMVLWGAGTKGKQLAKLLKEDKIDFQWVSNNPNKHGKNIYDSILESYENLLSQNNPQIIITVAQRNAKEEIKKFLDGLNLIEFEDYYFFR